MTQNQIAFQRLKEDRRHNVVGEKETSRHNVAQEGIGWAGVSESRRHNVQTEGINWYTAQSLAKLQSAQADYAAQQSSYVPYEAESRRMQAGAAQSQARSSSKNASTQAKRAQEEVRHHQVEESQAWWSVGTDVADSVTSGIQDVSRALFGNRGALAGVQSVWGGRSATGNTSDSK